MAKKMGGAAKTAAKPDQETELKTALVPGRYAYEGLERELHEKARLGIMMALAAAPDGLLFNELKQLCTLTDGNLNRHLKVLIDAALVEIWKGKESYRSKTLCRITRGGRERFTAYLAELDKVLSDARTPK